jgi:predicted metal-dependent HD superfamily phosphohydrolase
MDLSTRWQALASQLGLSAEASSRAVHTLFEAYQSSGRHYHTLDHLADLYGWHDRYQAQLQDSVGVQLAIWYHDVVYQPFRQDNEAQSAELALAEMRAWGLSEARVEAVYHLIMATAGHQSQGLHPDEGWFLDFDLSILGSDAARYDQYARDIRQEYRLVPGPVYRRGRKRLLQGLLDRAELYVQADMRTQLSAPARSNLRRELEEM